MVEVAINPDTRNGFILLTPNQSAHWHVVLLIVSALSLVIFIIAVCMALFGAWVILPFSGIEILAIAFANYYVLSLNAYKEVITFTPDQVSVEKGKRRPSTTITFQRHGTQTKIIAPSHDWYLTQVNLCSMKEHVSIGNFLNEEDRGKLIRALNDALNTQTRANQFGAMCPRTE
jgi:uncharacterized membrane protein